MSSKDFRPSSRRIVSRIPVGGYKFQVSFWSNAESRGDLKTALGHGGEGETLSAHAEAIFGFDFRQGENERIHDFVLSSKTF
jgi:hypothetical protein